jgi:hypothetical protein
MIPAADTAGQGFIAHAGSVDASSKIIQTPTCIK